MVSKVDSITDLQQIIDYILHCNYRLTYQKEMAINRKQSTEKSIEQSNRGEETIRRHHGYADTFSHTHTYTHRFSFRVAKELMTRQASGVGGGEGPEILRKRAFLASWIES